MAAGEGDGRPSSPERLEAWVRGRVQGVGFRFFVAREARRLGLDGWVRNEPDGAVHLVAQGPPHDLDALVKVLREGPMGADVRDVVDARGPAGSAISGFEIRAGGHAGD